MGTSEKTLFSLFFSIFVSQTQAFLSLNSPIAQEFSKQLMKNIKQEEKVTAKNCYISITTNKKFSEILIDLATILSFQEPIMLSSFNSPNNFSVIGPFKFKSSCRTNVLELPNSREKIIFPYSTVNGSTYDQFIFISENETILKFYLGKFKVLDKFVNKYGMYLTTLKQGNNIRYLVEPPVYTGEFQDSDHQSFYKRTRNLNGHTLIVSYLLLSPFFFITREGDLDGMQKCLLDEISKRANTTFVLSHEPRTPGFGNFENGSWTGLMGELADGLVDLATPLATTVARYPVFTFTTPEFLNTLIFTVKLPKLESHWEALVKPLNGIVWFLTLLFYFGFLFLFTLNDFLKNGEKILSLNIFKTALLIYTMLLDQPGLTSKLNGITRAITLLWIIFSYLIGVAYKSNLVGFLTLTENPIVPITFSELHEDKRYQTIVLHTLGGMELEMFRTSPSPVMKGIAKRMKITRNINECIETATNVKYSACIGWSFKIHEEVAKRRNLMNFVVSTDTSAASAYISLCLRKYSIFVDEITRYVGSACGAGLTGKWYEDNLRKAGMEFRVRYSDEENSEPVLTTNHLLVVFLITFVGFVLSILSFLLEHIYSASFGRKTECK
ncbi:unnamed protein product [Orchesella dallaii]|uniref:Ionotropic glutamate receptor L-glutamate and glycine-binding domain-containing protein n=1 Tax=Orchesella dallaii TaxID=48710 RepID=A0ABP1R6L9_9HEXA